MAYVVLDCSGLPCPKPVLRVKDALAAGALALEVVVDNEASNLNVLRFARSQGHQAESTARADGGFAIRITASGTPVSTEIDPELYRCDLPADIPRVIYVIAADTMGRGSEELGWALLQTFIQTIKEIQPLPSKILLYNSGVKLVTSPSGALEALKELQTLGVEVLACGTCLDFYQLKSAIQVGQITNMYAIMSAMAEADKIICPH